jgi:hypothetical protein
MEVELIHYVCIPKGLVISLPVWQVTGIAAQRPHGLTKMSLITELIDRGFHDVVVSLDMVIAEGVCDGILSVS